MPPRSRGMMARPSSLLPSSKRAAVRKWASTGASVEKVLRPFSRQRPSPSGRKAEVGSPPPWNDPSSGSVTTELIVAPSRTTDSKTRARRSAGQEGRATSWPTVIRCMPTP